MFHPLLIENKILDFKRLTKFISCWLIVTYKWNKRNSFIDSDFFSYKKNIKRVRFIYYGIWYLIIVEKKYMS